MSGISFVSLEDLGYRSTEEREKLINYFVDKDNLDALA